MLAQAIAAAITIPRAAASASAAARVLVVATHWHAGVLADARTVGHLAQLRADARFTEAEIAEGQQACSCARPRSDRVVHERARVRVVSAARRAVDRGKR